MRPCKVQLGRIYYTSAVGAAAGTVERTDEMMGFLRRHQTGDWGDLDAEDCATNRRQFAENGRVMSVFTWQAKRLYITTERPQSRHGAVTSLCFADEY